MSRVLHGMPLNTLPDPGELQTGDQIVAYREDTGKAYRSNIAGLGQAAQADITDLFSTTESYQAGDYVIYNNVLYKFTADKGIGDWDDSVVEATTIGNELISSSDSISSLNNEIALLNEQINEINSQYLKEDIADIRSGYCVANFRYPIATLGRFPILFYVGSNVGVMNVDGSGTTSSLSASHVTVSWLLGSGSGVSTIQSTLDTSHTNGVRVKITLSSSTTGTAVALIPLRKGYDCYDVSIATS